MKFSYRILLEFPTEDQVLLAYKSFTEKVKTDQQRSQLAGKKDSDTYASLLKDWRVSELSVSYLHKMEGSLDAQDKDLLLSQYLGHGIIRLFRLNEKDFDSTLENDLLTIPGDDTMVSILFVPTYFTVHDLLHFYIGDDIVNNQVSDFRILRNRKSELGFNFMVLMKFRDPLHAKKFKDEFNGKSFSKMDPENCHVVSIKEVVFKKTMFNRNGRAELPYLLTDPFTTTKNVELSRMEVELPTCPVCLERMDSGTTGLITIPCQHTFHCQCLDKWKNTRCPVCRYSSIRLSRNSVIRQSGETGGCSTCSCYENLWICLICGNIGCGRYNSKHAIKHYEDTSHCFAMDMQTQRVWDYAGDNYVHRLVQNEVDGKLVEVEAEGPSSSSGNYPNTSHGPSSIGKDNTPAANFMRNKEYHLEYVQVLVSQLESQREYYEMKLEQAQAVECRSRDFELLRQEVENMRTSFKKCRLDWESERKENSRQQEEDKLFIKGLQENIDHASEERERMVLEMDKLKLENEELQEQVRDLMFYLESQEKFKDADESVKEGTVVIQKTEGPPKSSKSSLKKKSKLKRKNK